MVQNSYVEIDPILSCAREGARDRKWISASRLPFVVSACASRHLRDGHFCWFITDTIITSAVRGGFISQKGILSVDVLSLIRCLCYSWLKIKSRAIAKELHAVYWTFL